jgi:TatD DNase family protein
MFIDIYSHFCVFKAGQKQFISLDAALLPDVAKMLDLHANGSFISMGIHPWNAGLWETSSFKSLLEIYSDERISLIGEIGLDKICLTPFDQQMRVFEMQIEIAEKLHKPVLLHVVHAMSEVLAMKKAHPKIPSWIIHGFRGGKQEAEQYATKGFYLSFGKKFNRSGVLACPDNLRFIESDEVSLLEKCNLGNQRPIDLENIYLSVAAALSIEVTELERQIEQNFKAVFLAQKKGRP